MSRALGSGHGIKPLAAGGGQGVGPLRSGVTDLFYDLALADLTVTVGMAKRAPPAGPAASSLLVQGNQLDQTILDDQVYFVDNTIVGNQTQFQKATFDPYQGTIVVWFTPEWDGPSGLSRYLFYTGTLNFYARFGNDQYLRFQTPNGSIVVDISGWTAGTTYCLVFRWDADRPLQGTTNYASVTVNNSHTYGGGAWSPTSLPSDFRIGNLNAAAATADGLIQLFTIFRRVLVDGNGNGVRPVSGNVFSGDELYYIYNGGSYQDPTIVAGSQDMCFCMPTTGTPGQIVSGVGEAHSWPYGSNLVDVPGMWDGGLPGTDYEIRFNGTSTDIDCNSDVSLDDLPNGAVLTVGAWIRLDTATDGIYTLVSKGRVGSEGWLLQAVTVNSIRFYVHLATTNAIAVGSVTGANISTLRDGKFHYVHGCYVDATKTAYVGVDGVWVDSDVGAGAYVSDAGLNLFIGGQNGSSAFLNGAVAWVELSDNDRHGAAAGTSFVRPRVVYGDGNTIEYWNIDEGTGGTTAAGVNSPANDGTITAGTWSSIWAVDGSPVIPYSLYDVNQNGNLYVNVGNAASVQDLPAGANGFTAELWIRFETVASGDDSIFFFSKGTGWRFYWNRSNVLFGVYYGGSNYFASFPISRGDGHWHHWRGTFNENTDKVLYLWRDGILVDTTPVGVGVYNTDVASNLTVGSSSTIFGIHGSLGPVRISNVVRNTTNFDPAPRTNWYTSDANTVVLYNVREGVGNTLTDGSPAGNNGTIFNHAWYTTPDMTFDHPIGTIYGQKGYTFGVTSADDGIYIEETVTPGASYAVFPVISIGATGRARPRALIYDQTNGVAINTFNGPAYYGTHTGGNNSPTLIPTTPAWVESSLINWIVYNLTDGSQATITANTEGVVTGVLAGGTDNDWDDGDEYVIRPPSYRNYCQYPWTSPITFAVPCNCTTIRVLVENVNDEGVIEVHQLQVVPNGMINPGFELTGVLAASRTIIAGTETGTLSNTQCQDGTDWVINETAVSGFQVEVFFTLPYAGVQGDTVWLYGHYAGNPAHTVNVDVWNYTTTAWNNLGTIPNAAVDSLQSFALTSPADQVSGTTVRIRFDHIAPFAAGHFLYLDYLWLETDPVIPRGWTTGNVDPGDTDIETTVVHSGGQSLQFNVGASSEYVGYGPTITQGKFLTLGGWSYGDGTAGVRIQGNVTSSYHLQTNPASIATPPQTNNTAVWRLGNCVARRGTGGSILLYAFAGAVGDRFFDDSFAVVHDDVSLTIVPASAANSLEGDGIRSDGWDLIQNLVIPVYLTPTHGEIRFSYTPRHDDADSVDFGWIGGPYIVIVYRNATNNLVVRYDAVGEWRIYTAIGGVGTATDQAFASVTGTRYRCRLVWSPTRVRLYIDGVLIITHVVAFNLGGPIVNITWGSDVDSTDHDDAVFGPY